jgi:hypothetical protein
VGETNEPLLVVRSNDRLGLVVPNHQPAPEAQYLFLTLGFSVKIGIRTIQELATRHNPQDPRPAC